MSNHKILETILKQSGEDLFSGYSLRVKEARRPPHVEGLALKVAAVLGFTGNEMRGTLMLAMTDDALEAPKQSPSDRAWDWIGELTNQLLGRYKNYLANYSVDIAVSTPLVIRGERLAPRMSGDQTPFVWDFDAGYAYAWLDAELKPDLVLTECATPEVLAREGDSMLF